MDTENKEKKTYPLRGIRTEFRFKDSDHHDMVTRAARRCGLSLNAWMVQATLAAARRDLGIK